MIEVSIDHIFLIPLVIHLLLIFTCFLYYSVLKAPARNSSRAKIYRCTQCKFVYLDERNVPLSRCSRCGCLNEAIRR